MLMMMVNLMKSTSVYSMPPKLSTLFTVYHSDSGNPSGARSKHILAARLRVPSLQSTVSPCIQELLPLLPNKGGMYSMPE
jgi:hypothetical protein